MLQVGCAVEAMKVNGYTCVSAGFASALGG